MAVTMEIKGQQVFLKSGDRSSELEDGKLTLSKGKLTYNGQKVELTEVEKEKSFSLLYVRLADGDYVIQVNVLRLKKKRQRNKKSSSLL